MCSRVPPIVDLVLDQGSDPSHVNVQRFHKQLPVHDDVRSRVISQVCVHRTRESDKKYRASHEHGPESSQHSSSSFGPSQLTNNTIWLASQGASELTVSNNGQQRQGPSTLGHFR